MILYRLVEYDIISNKTPTLVLQKATDSLELKLRKKVIGSFRRGITRMQQGALGLKATLGIEYCQTLAACFDPHSTYLPRTQKENFESSLGKSPLRFGFSLEQDEEDEMVSIHDLKPGTPAYKSGQLNKGDKIMAIQWEGKEMIDVSNAALKEVSLMLSESNQVKITITIKKLDGVIKKVDLTKEITETTDETRVKGFLLNNKEYTIGYISIPAFYSDWDNPQNNVNGCANDVAKEIIRLKKEGISGLIIDLRYNGGGSLKEAVDLSGIFIDAGPVAQISRTGEKVYTIKDVNRGTVYDGPLVVLVNGSSASASEMFAATLQDYHRGIIVGTPSFGKATAQVIFPLDTTVNLNSVVSTKREYDSYIKLTIEKLYRITGATLQASGVVPDVELPSYTTSTEEYEADQPFALRAIPIDANKYYQPYPQDSIANKIKRGKELKDSLPYFKELSKRKTTGASTDNKEDRSLQLKKILALKDKELAAESQNELLEKTTQPTFSVQNSLVEQQKLALFPRLQEIDVLWRKAIEKDHWLQLSFMLFAAKN
jgi:carboxyl-terminal processing protease